MWRVERQRLAIIVSLSPLRLEPRCRFLCLVGISFTLPGSRRACCGCSFSVPPLGYSTYFIRRTATDGPYNKGLAYLSKVTHVPESGAFETESHRLVSEEVITMKAGGLVADFNRRTGRLQSLHNTADKATVRVSHELLWYNASTGNHHVNPNQVRAFGQGAWERGLTPSPRVTQLDW